MKRVRHITAVGKSATLKITVELQSKGKTHRGDFIETTDQLTSNLMMAVHQGSDIPLTHIRQK